MTVDELLERMTMTELVQWVAYYAGEPKEKQSPETIKGALEMSLKAGKKKR